MGQKRMQQIDLESGEIIDGFVAYVAPKRVNGFRKGWVAVSQEPIMLLAQAGLGAQDYRVLLMMLAKLDFDNLLVVNQTEVADELGMQKSNVARSINRLVDMGVLLKGPKIGVHRSYRLNPRFGWKGSAESHKKALRERMNAARIEGVIEGALPPTDAAARDPRVADMWDAMQQTKDTVPPLDR